MATLTVEQAFNDLVRDGYLVDNGAGWFYVAKPPTKRDLAWFVAAIKVLSVWSVAGVTPARVQLSTGSLPDEIMFRLAK